MTPQKPRKKAELPEEERERRSELAKKLHAEGKFGGNQKGAGRPPKERASKYIAEKVAEDAEAIRKALKSGLKDKSASVRIKAALALLEIEREERDYKDKREDRIYDELSREELVKELGSRLPELERAGLNIGNLGRGT